MPRAPVLALPAVRHWVTAHVAKHPRDLGHAMADAFGVSRAAVAPMLRRLEEEAFVVRTRRGTRPVFAQGTSRYIELALGLPGVDESAVWVEQVAPWLDLAPNVENIVHYGVTEMVNNANDHSDGRQLSLRCACAGGVVYLTILDDGIGVFERMSRALRLSDHRLAVLELSKGRVTSDPARHTGEGIFFTSRAFPLFRVLANGLAYERRNRDLEAPSVAEAGRARPPLRLPDTGTVTGTAVSMAVRTDTPLQLSEVFARYTTRAPGDLSFDRTVVPVRLARVGDEQLLSRSQARRLLSGLDRFRRVELDFEQTPELGQAFADEVFRVWSRAHPEVELRVLNANSAVAAMIRRAGGKPRLFRYSASA